MLKCRALQRYSKNRNQTRARYIFLIRFVLVAELSDVLWTMVLHEGFKFTGVLGVVACFALFAYWAGEHFILPYFLTFTMSA